MKHNRAIKANASADVVWYERNRASRQQTDFVLYQTSNIDFTKRHFIARSLFIKSVFYVLVLCLRVCIVWTVFFSSIMLCALLSYVNTCACHVYFTINLLIYLSCPLSQRRTSDEFFCYPRESFSEGLWNHRRTFVCLSLSLSVTTITK